MRWFLFAFLLPTPLAAAWRYEPSTETRLTGLRLKADNPSQETDDLIGSLGARLRLLQDEQSTQYRHDLGLTHGQSLYTGDSYQVVNGRASVIFPKGRSTDSLSVGALFSNGADPVSQPIEQAVDENPSDFTSLQLSYGHQRELSPRDALRVELGLTQNQQAGFRILTEEGQFAYIYRPLRTWSTTWRLRLSQQQAADTEDNQLAEIANDHVWTLSPTLSAEAGLGYSVQQQGEESGEGLLYLAALNYSTQSAAEPEADSARAARGKTQKQPVDLRKDEGLRGSTLVRIGWTRSRDQRRVGDPIFVADQFFLTWGLGLSANQGLQLDLRQAVAPEGPQKGFRENTASLGYRHNHEYESAFITGQFGAEAGYQQTKNLGRTLEREVYTLLYGINF